MQDSRDGEVRMVRWKDGSFQLLRHQHAASSSVRGDIIINMRGWVSDIGAVYGDCGNLLTLSPAILWKQFLLPQPQSNGVAISLLFYDSEDEVCDLQTTLCTTYKMYKIPFRSVIVESDFISLLQILSRTEGCIKREMHRHSISRVSDI